jgi:hypothetical protein
METEATRWPSIHPSNNMAAKHPPETTTIDAGTRQSIRGCGAITLTKRPRRHRLGFPAPASARSRFGHRSDPHLMEANDGHCERVILKMKIKRGQSVVRWSVHWERPGANQAWTLLVCVGLCNMDSKLEQGQRCRCCSWF